MPVLVHCYNKGCGQKFDPEKNDSDVCQYHPGEPIFHDAKKKWSCCKKFSTDFTEFLNIKGCTMGKHNGVKPAEPSKPESSATPNVVSESVPVAPKTLPPPISASQPRPVSTEPMKQLRVVIAPSLLLMLEKLSLTNGPQNTDKTEQNGGKVIPGTTCKNSGCKAIFTGTDSDIELCLYHPGVPIFHEGMKFWTCCNRKTSEFETFMEQQGCTTGRHNWTEKAARETNLALSVAQNASCRYDYFQLPGLLTLSIYAKATLPDTVTVEANQTRLVVQFDFGQERQHFDRTFELFGLIDPSESSVRLTGTKMEIMLKKAEAMSWARLEHIPPQLPTGDEAE